MRNQIIAFSLLLSTIHLVSSQLSQLHFSGGVCLLSEDMGTNTTYSNNIISLLSNLTSLSSTAKFSNSSAGVGPNQVNGLYLCRPDLSLATCHECINTVASDLRTRCTDKREALIWYDECMVRYSNRSIFSIEEYKPGKPSYGFLNVSQPEIFPALLNETMEGLIAQAASPDNHQRFATGNTSFTIFEGLYGLVLCTPDITSQECEHCLTMALGMIRSGLSQWAMVPLPSCQLRYDTAPFIYANE